MKIDQEIIGKLKQAIDDTFNTYSYSGRGMYGKKCLAFNIDSSVAGAVARVISSYIDLYDLYDIPSDIHDIEYMFKTCEQDSMGLGTVLYFPQIEWVWGEEGE